MKQIEKHRLKNNWNYAKKYWLNTKSSYGLEHWTLMTMDTTDKAGMCSYVDCTIYLSTYFMRGHNCNYDKVLKVLKHEIAHALKPGHSHNSVWKRQCKQIGGDDRLGVTMVPHGMNWAVSCSGCKWRQEYHSRPRVDGMVCGKCKTPIKIKYIN